MDEKQKLMLCTAGGIVAGLAGGYFAFAERQSDNKAYKAVDNIRTSLLQFTGSGGVHGYTDSEMSILFGDTDDDEEGEGESGDTEVTLYQPADNYPDVTNNRSMMARFLTEELYVHLSQFRTPFGFTIDGCIQTGVDVAGKVGCGIVAGDEHCYETYQPLFDQVIAARHAEYEPGKLQHTDLSSGGMTQVEFDQQSVLSVHFLASRCLRGFRFLPAICRAERKRVNQLLREVFAGLQGEFAGDWDNLADVTVDRQAELPDLLQSIVDRPQSTTLQSSGANRDWPEGRGVFHTRDRSIFAWTNREDHLRVMYRDRANDFAQAFQRFARFMREVEMRMHAAALEFAFHKNYGYLLTCPSGVGTAFRAGVHMRAPRLVRDTRFKRILRALRLHVTFYNSESGGSAESREFVDVYNADRVGKTERELSEIVADGVTLLTSMERLLEQGRSIGNLIPGEQEEVEELEYLVHRATI